MRIVRPLLDGRIDRGAAAHLVRRIDVERKSRRILCHLRLNLGNARRGRYRVTRRRTVVVKVGTTQSEVSDLRSGERRIPHSHWHYLVTQEHRLIGLHDASPIVDDKKQRLFRWHERKFEIPHGQADGHRHVALTARHDYGAGIDARRARRGPARNEQIYPDGLIVAGDHTERDSLQTCTVT